MTVCATLLSVSALLTGLDWRAALIIGLGLALSSTALVMRGIDETGERNSPFGQTAIAVLLFEDLAIVPFLLLVTFLAPTDADAAQADNVRAVVIGVGAIALLIGIGRYALDPMFRIIARTPELMTAAESGDRLTDVLASSDSKTAAILRDIHGLLAEGVVSRPPVTDSE